VQRYFYSSKFFYISYRELYSKVLSMLLAQVTRDTYDSKGA
jgi:hypothetical protein